MTDTVAEFDVVFGFRYAHAQCYEHLLDNMMAEQKAVFTILYLSSVNGRPVS